MAIPLPIEARRGLGKLYKDLERKHWQVKWEEPRKLHITLAFLGMIDEERILEVVKIVNQVAQEIQPFYLGFKGVGAFPNLVWPKTVWLSVKGDVQSLAMLAKKIGLTDKPFQPHVTLGRIKKDIRLKYREDMGKQIQKLLKLDIPVKLRVDKVVVYESVVLPKGSKYAVLAKCQLRGTCSNGEP